MRLVTIKRVKCELFLLSLLLMDAGTKGDIDFLADWLIFEKRLVQTDLQSRKLVIRHVLHSILAFVVLGYCFGWSFWSFLTAFVLCLGKLRLDRKLNSAYR